MARKTKKESLKGEAKKEKVNEVVKPEEPAVTKEPTQGPTPTPLEGYKTAPLTNRPIIHNSKSYAELIEAYKKQNPKKYEVKKAALEANLRRLK